MIKLEVFAHERIHIRPASNATPCLSVIKPEVLTYSGSNKYLPMINPTYAREPVHIADETHVASMDKPSATFPRDPGGCVFYPLLLRFHLTSDN